MKVIKRELIREDTKELKKLQKTVKHSRFVPRIQMLILLKENPQITLNKDNEIFFLTNQDLD